MLDHNGLITLIDFGHAGLSGQDVPPHKQRKGQVKYLACYDFESLQELRRSSEKTTFNARHARALPASAARPFLVVSDHASPESDHSAR
ncbi:hypothetical protein BHE90_017669, partial [Fusarium euwallaceae]